MSDNKLFSNKFEVYKKRFINKEKVVRSELKQLSEFIDRHKMSVSKGLDTDGEQGVLQRHASHVQTIVDELYDIMDHMNKLGDSKKNKSTLLRFKNKI
mmetsp:Transcript_6521/g.7279  ORF Transcript_6521/g.7279 Transcript_6521/m.7279 type:complete len:98 (+) Transcript_6521:24-317(+)